MECSYSHLTFYKNYKISKKFVLLIKYIIVLIGGFLMYIVGKSKIDKGQLVSKSKICKYIELQLFNELENRDYGDIDDLFEIVTTTDNMDVIVLHAPLLKSDDLCLELIGDDKYKRQLYNTAFLAGELSKFYKHEIKIVIHFGLEFETLFKMPFLENRIRNYFYKFLSEYPLITFCIENVVPCKKSNDSIIFRNGCFFDNIRLINYYRELLKTDRIGSVLDTCHMTSTLRTTELIFGNLYPGFIINLNEDRFFEENKNVVKLIHLSDVDSLGYIESEHGILFRDNKIDRMEYFINLYKKFGYDCDITIEIQESDYIKNDNFRDNYRKLSLLLNKKHIDFL